MGQFFFVGLFWYLFIEQLFIETIPWSVRGPYVAFHYLPRIARSRPRDRVYSYDKPGVAYGRPRILTRIITVL